MTVFRILPNGARRRLPGGRVRALGANGQRFFDVTGSTSLGVDASGAAMTVVPVLGQTWLSFSLTASLSQSGTIGRTTLVIGVAGRLSSAINVSAATVLGFGTVARLTSSQGIRGRSDVSISAGGRLLHGVAMRGVSGLGLGVVGQMRVALALHGQAALGLAVTGRLSAKAGAAWREYWRDVYETRQALLNAIDANNRTLAKNAQGAANAAADAIVQTNVRVTAAENSVTAEAQRIAVLTGRVGNVEGTQNAQGTAISNLQTTQASQGNTLTSHSQQLVSVSSSISSLDGRTTANANATTALDSRVTVAENGVVQAKASWGVYLTAGNLVSGVQSINNGIISEFNVSAHVFRLISPAGADGMEIQDGYIRIWKGGSQTIMGNSFGAPGENLMRWFGPNIGAAACTKANATSWEDSAGNAYFGGSLSAGILRNTATSTVVSPSATAETGIFGTNGNPKVVVLSLSYMNGGYVDTALGTGALTATVVLERRRSGTGAWTTIGTLNATGMRTQDMFEPGLGYHFMWQLAGSITVTDTATGLADFEYRARITAATGGWPYILPPSNFGQQRLAIISTEQ